MGSENVYKRQVYCNCQRIYLPSSITSLNPGCITYSWYLEEDLTSGTSTSFSIVNKSLMSADKTVLCTVPAGIKGIYYVPNTTVTIRSKAFTYSRISQIIIPDSVKDIGSQTFWQCNSLSYAFISKGVTNLNINAFQDCPRLTTIHLGMQTIPKMNLPVV